MCGEKTMCVCAYSLLSLLHYRPPLLETQKISALNEWERERLHTHILDRIKRDGHFCELYVEEKKRHTQKPEENIPKHVRNIFEPREKVTLI